MAKGQLRPSGPRELEDARMAASPSTTVLCTARPSSSVLRFPPPRMAKVLSLFLAVALVLLAALPRPATSSSTSPEPIQLVTSCSGKPPSPTSSHAATSWDWEGDLASLLAAVCAGAVGAAHMSHSMSVAAGADRRTRMHGVAQCRPDVPVPDCAACLAAASSRLIVAAGSGRRAPCAAAAAWHDACFLRYSDRDPSLFREDDERTATVFNATRAPRLAHGGDGGRAAVRRLLAAAGKKSTATASGHMCRGVGGAPAPGPAGGRRRIYYYGLTRCAAGVSCDGCRRCLRGALAAAERGYNGSAGMQVLRLSCMARYESYPFYNATSLRRRLSGGDHYVASGGIDAGGDGVNITALPPAAPAQHDNPPPFPPPAAGHPPPPPAPPADHHTPPPFPPPAEEHPPPALPENRTPVASAASPPDQTRVAQQSHGKTPKMLITLIVSVVTGLTMVASVILVIIWYHRKQAPARRGHIINGMQGDNNMYEQVEEQSSTEEMGEDGERTSCQFYSYQVLENATHHFSNSNKLGSGGFGTVFRGTLENGKEVAVKRIRDSKRNIQELEREISIVSDLHHKNLVRFLGYCFQEEGRFLVYEYVPNNSLEKFWYKACFQSHKLEWTTWFNIIKGVARGLQFLHDKGIIHRDLKPHNVLLDENFNPKIADFDLMRMYDKQKTHESTEKVAGTFGYMAPECTSGRKFLLSIKSDVYSYGVLVLEIITGHKIYTFEGQNSEGLVEYVWQHWTEKRVRDVVDGDLLGVDDGQGHALRQALRCVHVALLCVQSDRVRRPTMAQVIAMLMMSSDADATEALQEPSLPGYVVRRPPPPAGGLLRLPCLARA